jgi:hypothetical protein
MPINLALVEGSWSRSWIVTFPVERIADGSCRPEHIDDRGDGKDNAEGCPVERPSAAPGYVPPTKASTGPLTGPGSNHLS